MDFYSFLTIKFKFIHGLVVSNLMVQLIFIPGLYCKSDVWNETVEKYKSTYKC